MEEIEREREVVDAKNLALSRLDFGQVQEKARLWDEGNRRRAADNTAGTTVSKPRGED